MMRKNSPLFMRETIIIGHGGGSNQYLHKKKTIFGVLRNVERNNLFMA